MIVYILAAGYATRLWPLTRDRPKPLLEVGGAPLLTHLVRRFEQIERLFRQAGLVPRMSHQVRG